MEVRRAARNTLTIWSKKFAETFKDKPDLPLPIRSPEGIGLGHQHWLLIQVQEEEVTGDKAHRWLAFAQGYLVAGGGLTLDDCKYANMLA